MAEKVNITFQPAKKCSERSIFAGVSKLGKVFSFSSHTIAMIKEKAA
jgi:hypothetical protein